MGIFQHTKVKEWKGKAWKGEKKLEITRRRKGAEGTQKREN
jgi:hypothetical protein